LPLIIDRNDY
jgi:hypothetical protein